MVVSLLKVAPWYKRFLRRISWTLFTVLDLQLVRRNSGELANALHDASQLLETRPPNFVFDVGARNGSTVFELVRRFTRTTVHCFEPSDEALQVLTDRFRDVPNVHCHQYAVCDRNGTATFRHNRTDSTNSLLAASRQADQWVDARHLDTVKTVEVQAITIDRFCEAQGIDHIGLLKLDIQGAELMAIAGAGRLLAASGIDLILSEVAFVPLYDGQPLFADVIEALARHGYVLYGLYELHKGRNGMLAWADALFMSPGVAESVTKAIRKDVVLQ